MTGSAPEQTVYRQEDTRTGGLWAAMLLRAVRRPWIVPAAVAGAATFALLVLGVIPVAIVWYALPLAGCLLMHLFMGHGGHGGHGGHEDHAGHDDHGGQAGPVVR